ncbi:hypothetical protein DUT90_12400 [Polaribacter sp. WD7]|uniref:DUF7151 family protein n=1 Tax=Polaribacter sp. WD7 TaxID=2269061 RepID=UPI000DF1FB61|nr:hypothetical protein [Polaribacter sp. WD7]RCS26550.1 hypothetical protein DUT90_12400 [Polaribacter sp. WD7]
MKKIIPLLILLFHISCEKEVLLEQEIKVSLINITPDSSENCENGGFKIETGIDTDNDGILKTFEVQSTNYICNGTNGNNGLNSLTNISEEAKGENCENGGYKVETGIDNNVNGLLDSNEIETVNYICNGTNGSDGLSSLIDISEEPKGENCENGGYKIETGVDNNINGILDSDEIEAVNYVCNGTNGNDGLNSLINISEEPKGENCENGGYKIEIGIDNDVNGILDSNEIITVNYICKTTNGNDGLNSLINISEEPKGENCENGGYKVETGIDNNINGILDSDEIEAVNYICNQKIIIPTNFNLETKYNIEGILTYGQSLAVGGGASNSNSDFKNTLSFVGGNSVIRTIDLSSFVKVEESSKVSYTPVMASTLAALNLIEKENNLDIETYGYQFLSLTGGRAGLPVSSMNKGTWAYQNVIDAINSAKTLADQEGKTLAWRVINWVQGEANRFDTKEDYYNQVEKLFNDFNSDIKAITGQIEDVIFIIHQTSPWLGRDLGGAVPHPHINVQEAQLQLANDKANVYMDGGSYQFKYSDSFHPSDRAVVGLKQGVVLKRILNDNIEWKTFQPISHNIVSDGDKFFIHLKFDVPVKPIRFDISGDIWHNPNGKQPNFGFEVLDNGVEQQITEPYITLGNTVVLTTDTNPVGMTIRYAVNGHEGGGNLCDSQNIVVENKGINYVIDNFAVSFSEYVID